MENTPLPASAVHGLTYMIVPRVGTCFSRCGHDLAGSAFLFRCRSRCLMPEAETMTPLAGHLRRLHEGAHNHPWNGRKRAARRPWLRHLDGPCPGHGLGMHRWFSVQHTAPVRRANHQYDGIDAAAKHVRVCLGKHVRVCLGKHVRVCLGKHVRVCLGKHVRVCLGKHVRPADAGSGPVADPVVSRRCPRHRGRRDLRAAGRAAVRARRCGRAGRPRRPGLPQEAHPPRLTGPSRTPVSR